MGFLQIFLIIITLGVSACSSPILSNKSLEKPLDPKPLIVLISIDGFKPEYLQRGLTPQLSELANTGAVAQGMYPVFPSLTFPNHYSIVTGLYPDHHGIVNNQMKDSAIEEPFKLSSRTAVSNPAWWAGGVPIWVTAQQQGLKSSTLFWPGSESANQGIQPNEWLYYDKNLNASSRVSKLLEWLNRPQSRRADFATLYFEDVDSMGHRYGPRSQEVNQAISQVDEAISQMIQGLKDLGLYDQTTFVIVSDHGMAEVPAENRIQLKSLLSNFSSVSVEWQGPLAGMNLHGAPENNVLSALHHRHMSCWPKRKIPVKYHFGTNSRIPDIICLADIGWTISEGAALYSIPGQHGYDPTLSDMQGIFIASGYGIKKIQLDHFENIEVYPILCHLLGIQAEKNDSQDQLFRIIKK